MLQPNGWLRSKSPLSSSPSAAQTDAFCHSCCLVGQAHQADAGSLILDTR